MTTADRSLSCVLIGSESLLIQCGEILRQRGHDIRAVVSVEPVVTSWAAQHGITVIAPRGDYASVLAAHEFDYLFSITNLAIVPQAVLQLPREAAINFHDGPLPRYAGLHAPAWALLNREGVHGITWHEMTGQVDQGDILKQATFPIAEGETSLTLNTKCYEAAISSFAELVEELASGQASRVCHLIDRSTYHVRADRPTAAATLSWDKPAAELAALARALDFGGYANPMGTPRFSIGNEIVLSPSLMVAEPAGGMVPGTIVGIESTRLRIAARDNVVETGPLLSADGDPVCALALTARLGARVGDRLRILDDAERQRRTTVNRAICAHEGFWTQRLTSLEPLEVPYASPTARGSEARQRISDITPVPPEVVAAWNARGEAGGMGDFLLTAFAVFLARLSGRTSFDIAFRDPALAGMLSGEESWVSSHVPLRVDIAEAQSFYDAVRMMKEQLDTVRRAGSFARDLRIRRPELRGAPRWSLPIAVEQVEQVETHEPAPGAQCTLRLGANADAYAWIHDPAVIDREGVERMQGQFELFLREIALGWRRPLAELPVMSPEEMHRQTIEWNDTSVDVPAGTLPTAFSAQVARTPDAVALVFGEEQLTYAELDARAERLAGQLRTLRVGPDVLVGLCVERSAALIVGLLAIHKAGGAYVPLDPAYPRERLAFMLEDAAAPVLLTQERLLELLPDYRGAVVCIDRVEAAVAPDEGAAIGAVAAAEVALRPDHLAYVIYTSGSTGRPKGVMVEHRNVLNFFAGMDARLLASGDRAPDELSSPGTWLAVTSLSFDISVLELLWTLSRGFTVVIHSESRSAAPAGPAAPTIPAIAAPARPLDFSLFYFSADAEADAGSSNASGSRYRLLLEGARFADAHGFTAVWTPERHFHAFGGLYPNPSVTGAAVAAVTSRIQIRAGSVVLPLHHPLRVAEEWSVVDNLSGGRVGVSFASGWQPNDFVLRPENFADAKGVLLRDLEVVRKLWRGEAMTLTAPTGKPVDVRIHPRPVQPELPVWLTTAGNPESFRSAGEVGANILTHLLGQSVEELATKLAIYREAWRKAGHPGTGHVSLMLHTFVGDDDAAVKERVRKPLTEYLRTSISLIKQYAWSFPAFKAAPDGSKPDFEQISAEEMEALLAWSFERYFETSAMLGTVDTCARMAERLVGIGVDEIACLIDFGLDTDSVLAHLGNLDALRARMSDVSRASGARPAAEAPAGEPVRRRDDTLPALVARHGVTHMQCTPSMATMLLADERGRDAFRALRCLLIGGEAFPTSLAGELRALVPGTLLNMYGPTETTIWSTVHELVDAPAAVPIGRPIANTQVYVVDSALRPVPAGIPGELLIGGEGVVRGYFGRPELTAERFVPDTIAGKGRLYRTGDLVRQRLDGVVEFLGRLDHQVKVRGHRIELGEIEAVIARHETTREAIAIVREDMPGDRRIVAYVVPNRGATVPAAELRDMLKEQLPEYMVPSHIVPLADMPRTPNGKVDRKALPAPLQSAAPAVAFAPPQNDLERDIAAIWQEVLKLPSVGTRDNFFDLGGHSLLAVQVHSRLRSRLSREVSITDLFRYPTIRALTDYLQGDAVPAAARAASGLARAEARRGALRRRLRTET